jgi:hypothetical protein
VAYAWEPRWEKYVVNRNGIIIHTCKDKVTGMIACPICINAAEKCLGGEHVAEYKYDNSFFFTDEDLIRHIRDYHGGRIVFKHYRTGKRMKKRKRS